MVPRTPNRIFSRSRQRASTQARTASRLSRRTARSSPYKSTSETPLINPKSSGTVPEVSEDGMTYTIKLRDDAKWSDGTLVTTRDVDLVEPRHQQQGRMGPPTRRASSLTVPIWKIIDTTPSITTETGVRPAWVH